MNATVPVLSGPLFFFVVALAAGALCYLVHRWRLLSGVIAGSACLLLAAFALRQASGETLSVFGRVWVINDPFVVLGRSWAFSPPSLAALIFVLIVAGLAFFLALPASQGWSYYAFGMGVVATVTMALTAEQYLYSILFIWLSAVLGVFVLSGGRPRATTGALRFLTFTSVAAMILLTVPGFLGPEANAPDTYTATLLTVIGFGILLMLVPFHGQLIALAAHTAPMVPVFVLSAFATAVFYTLTDLGETQPQLFRDGLLFDVCRWFGIAAVVIGGLSAAGQRRWGYLVGYATLVDWGAGLIAFGQGTREGVSWAVQMLIWRALSLLLIGTSWNILLKASQDDAFSACTGMLQRQRFAVLGLVGGLASLAGLPLTPGSIVRWPLIASQLDVAPSTAWVLALGGLGVCAGALRGLLACMGSPPADTTERRFANVIAIVIVLVAVWLVAASVLYPHFWFGLAGQMTNPPAILR
jgi:formate hydrogenlyase subunit 3/multisubunit Na+/H+ antiporter MnhD subunit